jgi:hypothetical protein
MQGRLLTQVTPGYSVEELFQDYGERYFPGVLFLYDSLSGRSFRIETGQGDSEVLWIDDNKIYYRVSNSLYQATIASDSIAETKLLMTDDALAQVHWAFMGPAAPKR